MNEKTEEFIERAPKLRKRDVDDINDLFESYIFLRRGAGEVVTTCCRKRAKLPPWHAIWNEAHVSETKATWWSNHVQTDLKNNTACPFCGKMGTVKELRYTGQRKNLWEERRFALLRWDGRALWIETGWAKKDYEIAERIEEAPSVNPGTLYRFGRDAVEYTEKSWYGGYHDVRTLRYEDFDKKTVDEPFGYSNDEGLSYAVLGLDALEHTPARWCDLRSFCRCYGEAVKFIHLAHVYPRQVEMLMKHDMPSVVHDLAKRGVKHAAVLDWKAKDRKHAFKVDKTALREFLALPYRGERDIRILERYAALRRKGERLTMREAEEIDELFSVHRDAEKTARRFGVPIVRLWRYLDRQNHCHVGQLLSAWADYVRMSEALGAALNRSDMLLPENIAHAHEITVAAYNEHRAEIFAGRQAERDKKLEAEYAERKAELERKYGWSAGGYLIRVPASAQEIRDEGAKLQHCVGGYAERHINGKTTILFLRREQAPDAPLLTIEMWGTELHQIHGYRNEGLYSAKGRFAEDPRETMAWFLDPWLDWIAKGSRRKKDGTPVVPKKRKEKKTA